MKKNGIVKEKIGNNLTVSIYKETACSHCNNCSESIKTASNFKFISDREDINIGDVITFEMQDTEVFKAAAIVYFIPLAIMFLTYFITSKFGFSEGESIASCFGSLIVSFVGLYFYDKFLTKNGKEKNIHIVSIEKKN